MNCTYEPRFIFMVKNLFQSFSTDIDPLETISKTKTMMTLAYPHMTHGDIRNLIFYIACSSRPEIAMCMMNNNMYTKKTFTTFYNTLTPLGVAIANGYVELVKCFIEKLEYFEELLLFENSSSPSFPPLFVIGNSPNGIKILEHILNSKHCTEKTFEYKWSRSSHAINCSNRNVLTHFINCDKLSLVRTLLNSNKCTTDVVIDAFSKCDIARNTSMFSLILKSDKLPLDYFGNRIGIFMNESVPVINTFLNSKYCNDAIVEEYFRFVSNFPRPDCVQTNCTPLILAHPKYLHLSAKYNADGSTRTGTDCEQNPNNDPIEKRLEDLQRVVEHLTHDMKCLALDNAILKIQFQKLEVENKILSLDKNIV